MKKALRYLHYALILVVVLAVVWVMVNGLGLAEGLDFGAGAYYYTDIPDFEKYVTASHFVRRVPSWIIFLLFFLWGGIMYGFWVWAEGRDRKKEKKHKSSRSLGEADGVKMRERQELRNGGV